MAVNSLGPLGRRIRRSGFFIPLLAAGSFAWAHMQQLVPVIREVNPSTSAVSISNAYVQVVQHQGVPYVSLTQMAVLLGGHLGCSAAGGCELTRQGRTIQFFSNSNIVIVAGHRRHIDSPTLKNDEGFWVPAHFFSTPEFFRLTRSRLDWPRPAAEQTKTKAAASQPAELSALPETPPKPLWPHAIRRIVIDPGHGGKDPGTVGAQGTEEKAINLLMAKELADALREKDGYEVLLTRMDDSFIPLERRSELANSNKADLFISLHCNASLSSRLKGFEVYFLSEDSSDPHANAVARQENASLALEGKSAPSPRKLAAVLRSLVKNANINEASALGSMVDRHVAERLSQPHLGVKEAAFYVLRGAEMPAILIETAFLSNANEERLLRNSSFRRKLIQGIEAAIVEYDQRKVKERET